MKIDIILMAAGASKRYGKENKLLHDINGKPVFTYALENAVSLRRKLKDVIENIIVVSRYDEIEKICSEYENVKYVYNSHSQEGISSSIHEGAEVSGRDNALMFMVCDQPNLSIDTLIGFTAGFLASGRTLGAVRSPEGEACNPCIFAPVWRKELSLIQGDKGGKAIINKNIDEVYFYKCENSAELMDIDKKNFVISIVGAGGKTSLMYCLAEMYSENNMNVLMTTTTHIYKPERYKYAADEEQLGKIWDRGGIAVMGEPCEEKKLSQPEDIDRYISLADVAIIEADGSRGMPCKVPYDHEPVVPEQSDMVIGVVGIDALGKPLNKVCYGSENAARLLGTDESHILTEEDIAEILSSEKGTMKNVGDKKYYVVINKCDSKELRDKGRKIKRMLNDKGIKAFVCSLKDSIYLIENIGGMVYD